MLIVGAFPVLGLLRTSTVLCCTEHIISPSVAQSRACHSQIVDQLRSLCAVGIFLSTRDMIFEEAFGQP